MRAQCQLGRGDFSILLTCQLMPTYPSQGFTYAHSLMTTSLLTRINVGKNTCGKIGEEVLMRSFSLGSHRSSQPSSTRNSWLFAYVNRGRDFLEEFSTIGKGRLWDMISIMYESQGCQIHQEQKWSMESCWWFCHNHFYKSLFEDVWPQRDWLTCGARCVGSEPPKCRRPHANGILRVSIWTAQSVLAQPKASTSLL